MTSDKYLSAIPIFMWCMRKYWEPSPEVIVAGFSAPTFTMPPGSIWMSLGKYENYPVGKWSNGLIKALKSIDDELIIIMLEDYWLTREVNSQAVLSAAEYCRRHQDVIRMDLTGDRLYAHGADLAYDTFDSLDIIKSMPGSPYHLSLMTGIWRRQDLLNIVRPGWSPWDVEIVGTITLSHSGKHVLGTRQWPVRHTLGFRGGDVSKINLAEMSGEDVRTLKSLGYLGEWIDQ